LRNPQVRQQAVVGADSVKAREEARPAPLRNQRSSQAPSRIAEEFSRLMMVGY
jgi:hypothetical protein